MSLCHEARNFLGPLGEIWNGASRLADPTRLCRQVMKNDLHEVREPSHSAGDLWPTEGLAVMMPSYLSQAVLASNQLLNNPLL